MKIGANADVETPLVGHVGFNAVLLAIGKVLVNSFAKTLFEGTDTCAFICDEVPYPQQTTVQKFIRGTV